MEGNIKIVIGSWGSYNECNERALGSKWLDLSDYSDWDEIREELKKEGFELDGIDEELFIQDVEGIEDRSVNWDYVNPETLFNTLKESGVLDDDYKYKVFCAFLEVRCYDDFEEKVNSHGDRWDDCINLWSGYSWEDYGKEMLDCCGYEIPEQIIDFMNQYYSAELSQKVLRGLNESYRKGNYTGGMQIFGYKVVDKKNVIDPFEAEIVQEIFRRFAKGETGKSIADNLIARGIRTKSGHYVDDKRIYKIIQNTKYIGKVQHGDTVYTNIYPAIIDEVTWQTVQSIRNANKHSPGSKKERFDYLLSGKLICGDCKQFMVGVTSTNRWGTVYKYYTCLSKRRKKQKCGTMTIHRKELEDLVFNETWKMLYDNNNLDALVEYICKLHQNETQESTVIKSLEKKRADALKASANLISAIEQGIITEQTKIRLKELETQISQYDFDIEQAKQRTYSYLTPELIKEFFQKAVCGDIESNGARKLIVRNFIREVILYKDKVVITFNFTDQHITKKRLPDSIEEVERTAKQAEKSASKNKSGVYKNASTPPLGNNTNPNDKLEFVLFFSNEYFGIKVDLNGKKKNQPSE